MHGLPPSGSIIDGDLAVLREAELSHRLRDQENQGRCGFYGKGTGLWKLRAAKPELFGGRQSQSETQLDEQPRGVSYAEELQLVVAGAASRNASGRKVIIEDLHKVAHALKQKLDQFDKPSTMLAVLRGDDIRITSAARQVHTSILQRLASFSGDCSLAFVQDSLKEVCEELSAGEGEPRTSLSILLLFGKQVYFATTGDMQCIVLTGADSAGFYELGTSESVNGIFADTFTMDPTFQGMCLVSYGSRSVHPSVDDAAGVFTRHVMGRRPRAAASAVVADARKRLGEEGSHVQTVVAAAQWKGMSAAGGSVAPPPKKQRLEVANKVRVRHILVRHTGAKVPGMDPVRKKPIERSLEDAETLLLSLLVNLLDASACSKGEREVALKFTEQCKNLSECETSLKGGAFAGDLGWMTREEKAMPASIMKAAFALELGQVSDIVSSDLGVHLLLRTA